MTEQKVTKKPQPKQVTKPTAEARYTYDEIVEQADAIGERVEVLAGALLPTGKDSFTRTEIKRYINEFKNKEVK